MSGIVAQNHGSEADYGAIELAVMETERGRWFLGEYAKRNRHADTQVLLSALSRIEKSIAVHTEPTELDKFRMDILEMSKAIARTRAEIAAIKPDDSQGGGKLLEASGELDSIVSTTERATSDILAAAERVQEAAWTLREAQADPAICDMLDERATEIYTACSFQDLTSQRIRKVIEALGFLEKRVKTMVEIWQFGDDAAADEAEPPPPPPADVPVDPTMSQADVDFVLVEEGLGGETIVAKLDVPAYQPDDLRPRNAVDLIDVPELPGQPAPAAIGALAPLVIAVDDMLFEQPDQAPRQFVAEPLQLLQGGSSIDEAMKKVRSGAELSAEEAAKALDLLKKMSVEDRTRLFS
jgi:hypothetical protein